MAPGSVRNDGRIKILDFGIAKLTRPSDDDVARHTALPTETGAGMVVGTASYMSPEQVRGDEVDARSDMFSVGTVLYEMLTGRPAFSRETAAETMAAILKEDPPPPLAVGRGRRARVRTCGRGRVEPQTTGAAAARHSIPAHPARDTVAGASAASEIQVVLNWFEELKARVPATTR